jgi:hypothetical protein
MGVLISDENILQASISLSEAGDSLDHCDKLIELVASSDSGMIHLFSQQQIQVTLRSLVCSSGNCRVS